MRKVRKGFGRGRSRFQDKAFVVTGSGDQTFVVNSVCQIELPARRTWNEFVEIFQLATVVPDGVAVRNTILNAWAITEGVEYRAGMPGGTHRTNDFALFVDGLGEAFQ